MSLVLPWFETEKNVEAGIVGKRIKLECSARGYPLDVEWRVTKKIAEDDTITSCISKLQKPIQSRSQARSRPTEIE